MKSLKDCKMLNTQQLEIKLNGMIEETYQLLKDLHPQDGLTSPRDIELTKEINKVNASLEHMQNAMRVFNPNYEIRN